MVFTIYFLLRFDRPRSQDEATKFYQRFKHELHLSYACTYMTAFIAPMSCYFLHCTKTGNQGAQWFFTVHGFLWYVVVIVYLMWSIREARLSIYKRVDRPTSEVQVTV